MCPPPNAPSGQHWEIVPPLSPFPPLKQVMTHSPSSDPHPDKSVKVCAAKDANDPEVEVDAMKVENTPCAPALCRMRHAATPYRLPMSANGNTDDIVLLLTAACGAPIIIPYSGNTATVPMLNRVSGSALVAVLDETDDRRRCHPTRPPPTTPATPPTSPTPPPPVPVVVAVMACPRRLVCIRVDVSVVAAHRASAGCSSSSDI